VLGHVNVTGNERADTLAKAAITHLPLTIAHLKRLGRERMVQDWEKWRGKPERKRKGVPRFLPPETRQDIPEQLAISGLHSYPTPHRTRLLQELPRTNQPRSPRIVPYEHLSGHQAVVYQQGLSERSGFGSTAAAWGGIGEPGDEHNDGVEEPI